MVVRQATCQFAFCRMAWWVPTIFEIQGREFGEFVSSFVRCFVMQYVVHRFYLNAWFVVDG